MSRDKIIGTWIGPSKESYDFDGELCKRRYPGSKGWQTVRAEYSICGNTLTLVISVNVEDREKIDLTFSDDENQVRFDWIDGTKRRWDDAKSVWLRRENTN